MIKKEKVSKNNVVNFPSKLSDFEKEIEAVIFAASEPLDLDTIESKISKKVNILLAIFFLFVFLIIIILLYVFIKLKSSSKIARPASVNT